MKINNFTAKRRHSPRRSPTPKSSRRRGSLSPRRRSPRRSLSPRHRPVSPPKSSRSKSSSDRSSHKSTKAKSPVPVTSPMDGLKRSVADSTISDDLLPQPAQEYTNSPMMHFYERSVKHQDSPKRESLDARINQALGITSHLKSEPHLANAAYPSYGYESQFMSPFGNVPQPKSNLIPVQCSYATQSKSNFVQVGNMVQILPTEDICVTSQVTKSDTTQIVQVILYLIINCIYFYSTYYLAQQASFSFLFDVFVTCVIYYYFCCEL